MGGVAPHPQNCRGVLRLRKVELFILGIWPRNSMSSVIRPSVDCPWGPGLGGTALEVSKWHPLLHCGRKRRGGKGRRPNLLGCFVSGACLFLSLLRVRQRVGVASVECPPVARWARDGVFGTAASQLLARGLQAALSQADLGPDPIPPGLLLGAQLRCWA